MGVARTAAVAMGLLALVAPAALADGGGDDGAPPRERSRVEAADTCGTLSAWRLRVDGDGEELRADYEIRGPVAPTRARARWSVTVLHERRIVERVRVRARQGRLRLRVVVPDYAGPDEVRVRALAPWGEVCAAAVLAVPEERS